MQHWPTGVDGDPAGCRAAGSRLSDLGARLRQAALRLSPDCAAPDWSGPASRAADGKIAGARVSLSAAADRCDVVARAVTRLGADLSEVTAALADAAQLAVSDGLTVDATGFFAEAGHRAVEAALRARAAESTAHARLRAGLPAAPGPDASDQLQRALLHLPPEDGDALDMAAWAVRQPGAVAGLPGQWVNGHLSWAVHSASQSTDDGIRRIGSVLEAAKPVGKQVLADLRLTGNVLTVGLSARSQWQEDAIDPAMSDTERVTRSAVRGTIEGGATIVCAAALGGFLSPIPGGAFVGGAAGGWAGKQVGGKVADIAVDHVDDALELVQDAGDTVSGAAEAVRDAADVVGDAAEDVGDKIVFWK